MAEGQTEGQRIILTSPIPRTPQTRDTQGYGAREAFIEIDLAIRAARRRLLKANDEHGNKNLRKFILDEFGEVERFALNRLVRAGVFNASEYDTGETGEFVHHTGLP